MSAINHILLMTVINPAYPITCDIINQICSSYGKVLRIVIFKKNGLQAMVEFDSIESAKKAKQTLHGCDIYNDCCTLRVEYAKPTRLNVYKNDSDSYDYTNITLGSGGRDGRDGGPHGPGGHHHVGGGGGHHRGGSNSATHHHHHHHSNASHHHHHHQQQQHQHQNQGYDAQGDTFHHEGNFGVSRGGATASGGGGSGSGGAGGSAGSAGSGTGGPPQPSYPADPYMQHGGDPYRQDSRQVMVGPHNNQTGLFSTGPNGSGPLISGPPPLLGGAHQGCVMMVYGLNHEKVNCDRLFNLFCLYGNVVRVKFLRSKEGCAMVQMGELSAVDRCVTTLNSLPFFGCEMQLSYSKQAFLNDVAQPFDLPDGSPSFTDFMGNRYNRFTNPEAASKNRISAPAKVLHFFNAPHGCTEDEMVDLFKESCSITPSAVRFFPSKCKLPYIHEIMCTLHNIFIQDFSSPLQHSPIF